MSFISLAASIGVDFVCEVATNAIKNFFISEFIISFAILSSMRNSNFLFLTLALSSILDERIPALKASCMACLYGRPSMSFLNLPH